MVGLITSFTLGCGSTTALPPEEPAANTESDATGSLFQEWQKETREQTDDLLAEAHRLANLGDDRAALDRIDEALCLVLDPPEGSAGDPVYLDFVAGLLADAEVLEHSLTIIDDLGEQEELVALPPIEVPDTNPEESLSLIHI